jgi:hypothetical protein
MEYSWHSQQAETSKPRSPPPRVPESMPKCVSCPVRHWTGKARCETCLIKERARMKGMYTRKKEAAALASVIIEPEPEQEPEPEPEPEQASEIEQASEQAAEPRRSRRRSPGGAGGPTCGQACTVSRDGERHRAKLVRHTANQTCRVQYTNCGTFENLIPIACVSYACTPDERATYCVCRVTWEPGARMSPCNSCGEYVCPKCVCDCTSGTHCGFSVAEVCQGTGMLSYQLHRLLEEGLCRPLALTHYSV